MARLVLHETRRRGGFFNPTQETFDAFADLINWAEYEVPSQLHFWTSELAFHMALLNQGFARRMSFGPADPQQQDPSAAWRLPVRRITGAYYVGWKVRQLRPGVAQLYNDSREAYFIEFGINWLGSGRRVRRPVRKLSLIQTMKFMSTTKVYDRVWASVYKHNGKGFGFHQTVQAPGGGHMRWENISEHQAGGLLRGAGGKTISSPKLRRLSNGQVQHRVPSSSGGSSYSGPMLGRRLP